MTRKLLLWLSVILIKTFTISSAEQQPKPTATTYLVELRHDVFKHLFGTKDTRSLSTIPMCYSENTNKTSGGGTRIVKVSSENYTQFHKGLASSLTVGLDVQIIQLISLNEKTQTVGIVLSTIKIWSDCRLTWNNTELKVNVLELTPSVFRELHIFTPGIRLLEAVNPKENVDAAIHVGFNYQGAVHLIEEFFSQISCGIDVAMYPFDIQTCYLTFESIYSGTFVDLNYKVNDVLSEAKYLLGRYTPNDQWSLTVLPPVSTHRLICDSPGRACVNDNLKFRLILRRNPNYQLLNLFFPVFFIVVISSCVFVIPPGGGDKMGLSVSILLSLYMFSQLMYDKMPESNAIPHLSQYFLECIMLVTASCIYSAFSAVLASAYPQPPNFICMLVALLGPLFIFDQVKMTKRKRTSKFANQAVFCNVTQQKFTEDHEAADRERDIFDREPTKKLEYFNGFNLDEKDALTWSAFGALLDRLFFVAHLVATVLVMVTYLTYGYIPWTGYSGLKLNDTEKAHVCAQLKMQNMPADDLPCAELLSQFK